MYSKKLWQNHSLCFKKLKIFCAVIQKCGILDSFQRKRGKYCETYCQVATKRDYICVIGNYNNEKEICGREKEKFDDQPST